MQHYSRQFLITLPRPTKRLLAIATDCILCMVAVWLALCLRLEHWVVAIEPAWWWAVAGSVALAVPVFWRYGLYASIFRSAGWHAMTALMRAMAIYGLLYALVFTVLRVPGVPRSVGVLQPLLLFVGVVSSRVGVRFVLGNLDTNTEIDHNLPGVLIYGAGEAGRQLASGLEASNAYRLLGFIDDDPDLQGRQLDMIPVYGMDAIPVLVREKRVTDVLLALPSASRKHRLRVIERLRPYPVHVRTLPSLADLVGGRVSLSDLYELDTEDLLGREPARPNRRAMRRYLEGSVVLVTGAGGSIGRELCRQILQCRPSCMLLLERTEFALYRVHQELQERAAQLSGNPVKLVPLLGSVADEERMIEVVSTWRPQIVYHAAAYKHVPLVEYNMAEGLRNNVWGTWICARVAARYGVGHFVLVSTDKAVRPTNVMGASKRLAEMILQALAREGRYPRTCFTMVRFGNVLGSSGSVVPLFRKQIAHGGPVTVTHEGVTRYFMTISEAAQLVIEAGIMAQGGDVFLLDMGDPVRIYDLARRMIELSGLRVKDRGLGTGDIEIRITGLRPGEKLYEELLIGEDSIPTRHPKIMRANETFLTWDVLQPALDNLVEVLARYQLEAARELLLDLVAGYAPANEVVDTVFVDSRLNDSNFGIFEDLDVSELPTRPMGLDPIPASS